MTTAFPIAWPIGVPRTEPGRRATSQFKTSLGPALKNVEGSLRRFGETTGKRVTDVVISSNYSLGVQNPTDPGVAVWFVWDGKERCIAVDRYPKLEHNLQAIHYVLEARITEARHGGLRIVQQTFTGFIALPSPTMIGEKTCWEILGIQPGAPREKIEAAHKAKARSIHPDAGGDGVGMAELNVARDVALGQVLA
ncbi:J domain-containing protein [Sphingomonas sp. MMS24-J13]|uniref:J domain-containing protein n=1 Tax=Sphingomonas sp. MMS24-J13 TaxID=3238686 RepID=UPI00384CEDD3